MKQTRAQRTAEKVRLWPFRYGNQGPANFGTIRTAAVNTLVQTRAAEVCFAEFERKLIAAGWSRSPLGLTSPDGTQEVTR